MKSIWKIPLEVTDTQIIEPPKGSKFLSVQSQHDMPMVWLEVNPNEAEKEHWRIRIFGTGHEMPTHPLDYLGTCLVNNGNFVGHVYRDHQA